MQYLKYLLALSYVDVDNKMLQNKSFVIYDISVILNKVVLYKQFWAQEIYCKNFPNHTFLLLYQHGQYLKILL
jgi:hypothetical protein